MLNDIVRPILNSIEMVIKKAMITKRTDFGTLKFVPNRLQPKFTIAAVTNAADVFILDPSYLSISYLQGYRTEELAKTGSANNRQILVDWTLCVGNEKAQAMLNDINPATAVVA